MAATSAVERAFEVAATCATLEEIRRTLRAEGYVSVGAHLTGGMLRGQLSRLLGGKKAGGPTPASSL